MYDNNLLNEYIINYVLLQQQQKTPSVFLIYQIYK